MGDPEEWQQLASNRIKLGRNLPSQLQAIIRPRTDQSGMILVDVQLAHPNGTAIGAPVELKSDSFR
jgi:uncharacterized protein (DUF2252 family)